MNKKQAEEALEARLAEIYAEVAREICVPDLRPDPAETTALSF